MADSSPSANTSSQSASSGGGLFSVIPAVANSIITPISAKRQQARNMKNAKELAEIQQAYNLENMAKQQEYYEKNLKTSYDREDFLNANQYRIMSESLRNAGFNPSWATQSGDISTSSVNSSSYAPSSSAPSIDIPNFSSPFSSQPLASLSKAMQESRLIDAQIGLMKSQSNNLDSDTEGKELNNDFFRNVKTLKEDMTKGEYEQMLTLQQYYKDNPELLKAVADAQSVMNEKLQTESAKMLTEMDEIASAVGRNKAETRLANEKALSEQLDRTLTKAQIQLCKDQNFRENFSNPSYLVHKSYSVEHSNLPDNEKNEQLAFLRECLDECSNYSSQQREHAHESAMQNRSLRQSKEFHEDEMELRGAALVVRSFDTLEGTLRHWSRKSNKGNSKKSNYPQKKGRESKNFRKYIDIFENQ